MREFNEKRVYKTMEIPLSNIKKIQEIILNNNISFNEFVNISIENNFKNNLNKINIYKREEGEPIKLRIYESIYKKISEFTIKNEISITKLINHCIYEEIKKYEKINKNI